MTAAAMTTAIVGDARATAPRPTTIAQVRAFAEDMPALELRTDRAGEMRAAAIDPA